ncbi:helix-turn-helix domain-containing protein [Saccharothrix texasensis]|uniref:Excisionase family DNA binding protein n=1 Tax=Saccharothrix texasensis TaxID=103734 RepID=A0A3N1H945_9PSEU|nr:helix-turn-helix domain-containing protein [Saccharothrix texasensis]ROP38966.1 excisionase family DNA binding protein [Saccharothrix texasensis]
MSLEVLNNSIRDDRVEPEDEPCRTDLPRPIVLTVKEACQVLRISRWTLYDLIRARAIETITIGRSRRIPVSSVSKYIERRLAEDLQ